MESEGINIYVASLPRYDILLHLYVLMVYVCVYDIRQTGGEGLKNLFEKFGDILNYKFKKPLDPHIPAYGFVHFLNKTDGYRAMQSYVFS